MIPRRSMLLVVPALAMPAIREAAAQQESALWPMRQARIVMPFGAGTALDTISRMIAERLTRRLSATFIVENKPGAGGSVGTMDVVRAPANGSALLATSSSVTILPFLQPRLGFDPVRDLVPISLLTEFPIAVGVRAASPIADLEDLVARARAAPGRLTYGSGGVGSAIHMATALFASMAGIELLHVPYAGFAQAFTSLHAGTIDLLFGAAGDLLPARRQGGVRLLGIGSSRRVAVAPDVPAIDEVVKGYTNLPWNGLFAPRGMAPALVERVAAELAAMRDEPDLQARLTDGATVIRFDGPAPLAERLAQEGETWRALVVRENIRPE
jgi:tripartite-type tricarboxylate transporter receptor subunit TctC